MSKNENLGEISQEVEKLYLEKEELLLSSEEWVSFVKSYNGFRKSAFKASLPFDPRFNAVHWGVAVSGLCREIAFGYCWMNAYARHYRSQTPATAQPANVDFHVSYFADNSITRINSCRDKIALMVWAFYCPFNPEKQPETLDYVKVLDRLKHPLRFGLSLKNHQSFVSHLETLHGQDFARMVTYRHLKIHRMEPRIEVYGVKPHHGWDYMFPLYEQNEIARWEQKIERLYPDQKFRECIVKGCHINEVIFETRRIKDSLWNYDEVKTQIRSCLAKLLQATAGCFDILRRRAPLKNKRKTKGASGMLLRK
ncbi:MAG: hypothetical protein KAS66_15700 [Candidatus Omnitrophica bacterium]|nr:hypothetical protein [Candidatus Omnitrophota bacterium]